MTAFLLLLALVRGGEPGVASLDLLRIYRVDALNGPELVVYLPSETRTPSVAPDRPSVLFECFDAHGRTLVEIRRLWPGGRPGLRLPHFHHELPDLRTLRRVSRCRLTGTPTPLDSEPRNRAPMKKHPPDPLANPGATRLTL